MSATRISQCKPAIPAWLSSPENGRTSGSSSHRSCEDSPPARLISTTARRNRFQTSLISTTFDSASSSAGQSSLTCSRSFPHFDWWCKRPRSAQMAERWHGRHYPVLRHTPGNQALNDIGVIPEYYPCWIPGGGQTGLHCNGFARAGLQAKWAYPEAI